MTNVAASTNANLDNLANVLAEAHKGFTGLIIKKTGVEKGGVRYEDDFVHAVIVTGFKYQSLVERSLAKVQSLGVQDTEWIVSKGYHGWERVWKKSDTLPGLQASCQALGLDSTGKKADLVARLEAAVPGGLIKVDLTRSHVDEAITEVVSDLQRTLDGETEPTNGHVFEPLVVNGEKVRGCRVYVGPADDTQELAAPKGTVYLQGLMIGQKVLVPAENGKAPESMSAPLTVAKNLVRRLLPVGRYVSYKLEPSTEENPVCNWILNIGGEAVAAANTVGVEVSSDNANEAVAV
jgi:hypothetical protein